MKTNFLIILGLISIKSCLFFNVEFSNEDELAKSLFPKIQIRNLNENNNIEEEEGLDDDEEDEVMDEVKANEYETNEKIINQSNNSTTNFNSPNQNQTKKIHKHHYTDKCQVDSDCRSFNYCDDGECSHVGFFPIKLELVLGILFLFFGLSLSAAIGFGGGGLLLPILIIIMNFYSHQAIPIAKSFIFINSSLAFLIQIREKHPRKNSITIDFTLASSLIPGLLIGTTLGVLVNKLINGLLLTIILSILLLVLSLRLGYKAYLMVVNELKKKDLESKPFKQEEEMSNKSNDAFFGKNKNHESEISVNNDKSSNDYSNFQTEIPYNKRENNQDIVENTYYVDRVSFKNY